MVSPNRVMAERLKEEYILKREITRYTDGLDVV
jgi:hypothetical protein